MQRSVFEWNIWSIERCWHLQLIRLCINAYSLFEANFHFGVAACLHFILALLTYPLLRRLIKVYLHCVIPDVFWCCIIIVAPLAGCLLFIRHPLPPPASEYIKSFPLERSPPPRDAFFCAPCIKTRRCNRRCFTLGNNVIQAAGASWIKRHCYLWIGLVIPLCALCVYFKRALYIMQLQREDLIIYGVAQHHLAGSLFNTLRAVVHIWWFVRLSGAHLNICLWQDRFWTC